jgi:predicted nucleotidyltransferase
MPWRHCNQLLAVLRKHREQVKPGGNRQQTMVPSDAFQPHQNRDFPQTDGAQTATHLTFSADCEWPVARLIESTGRDRKTLCEQSRIRRHLPDPVYRIFLFGSRAAGSAAERSDIDIGIEGPAPVPRSALAAIHDELEEAPTLYTIDVVDFACVPEKFRRVAQQRISL